MYRFIELTSDVAKEKTLVNINEISTIQGRGNVTCIVFCRDFINVTESYEEIKKMIAEVTK